MKILYVICLIYVNLVFFECQITSFKGRIKQKDSISLCCQEPHYNSLKQVFNSNTIKTDDMRAVNQIILDQIEQQMRQLSEKYQQILNQFHQDSDQIAEVTSDVAQNMKYNMVKQRDMEQKLLQISLDFVEKIKIRQESLKKIYDPQPILKNKILVTSNSLPAIRPMRKVALLHNKYNFEVYHLKDMPVNKVADFAWLCNNLTYEIGNRMVYSHFPNMGYAYHHKYLYYQNLIEYDQMNDFHFKSNSFVKPSYMINITSPNISIWEQKLFNLSNSNIILIEKLPKLSLGRGIIMQKNITAYIEGLKICKFDLVSRPQDCPYNIYFNKSYHTFDNTTFLQEYIMNPLLLGGRKFDMRAFVLSVYSGKHFIYYYHTLNIRRALNKYDINSDDVSTVHATHTQAYDIYKKNKTYDQMIQYAQSHIPGFEEEFKKEHTNGEQILRKIYHKQKQILVYAILAGERKIVQESFKGQHHLFGCDLMYDTEFNPWLIECNRYPQIRYTTPQKEYSMPTIAKNTFDIVMHFQDNWDNMDEVILNPDKIPSGNMTMIYNSATNYNIINVKLDE